MKKVNKVISALLLGMLLCGCSNKAGVDTFADISNGKDTFNSGKEVLTAADLYQYIRQNYDSEISKTIVNSAMEKFLFSGDETVVNQYKTLYKKYLDEYFKSKFIDVSTYKLNDEFNEEKLVQYLKSESYTITCDSTTVNNLDSNYFSCDYSDYISKEVNYDIYLKMLKVKYILEEKSSLLDKSKARKLVYIQEAKDSSSTYTIRETFENYLKEIKNNYTDDNKSIMDSMKDIADSYKTKELEKISNDYEKISSSEDSSSYTYLKKFTTCGSKRCNIVEGKAYLEKQITDKEYLNTKIIIKSNTSDLFDSARNVLFGDSLEEYLYTIGDKKFLISPSFDQNTQASIKDAVVYDGSSNYYLIIVDVIDSNSQNFEDKVSVAELLIDSVSDSLALESCFKNINLSIYDKQIREYFISKYGEYENNQ